MGTLPSHRRILNGRTFRESWNPASFDPIERPRSMSMWRALILWLLSSRF